MSREFQEDFKEISVCFKSNSRVPQERFDEKVSLRSSKVFRKITVACHSSQLPEQKEGLCCDFRQLRNL